MRTYKLSHSSCVEMLKILSLAYKKLSNAKNRVLKALLISPDSHTAIDDIIEQLNNAVATLYSFNDKVENVQIAHQFQKRATSDRNIDNWIAKSFPESGIEFSEENIKNFVFILRDANFKQSNLMNSLIKAIGGEADIKDYVAFNIENRIIDTVDTLFEEVTYSLREDELSDYDEYHVLNKFGDKSISNDQFILKFFE